MFWLNVAVMTIIVAGFLVFGLSAALRLRRTSPTTGVEQMLHEKGTAQEDLAPEGTVKIHGEIWKARSDHVIHKGTIVEVTDMEGLLLIVQEQQVKGGETSNG